MDSLAQRWSRLSPHVAAYGPPDDRPRPAVLLFHGCGGVKGHLPVYAEAAAQAGFRAYVVDSYAARRWPPAYGLVTVCTGMAFRGWERAGDIAASVQGVSALPGVDACKIALAGWSHGGWGIMELMASPLTARGEIGVSDPHNADLSGVRGVFLAYPYIGPIAVRRTAPWARTPAAFALIARRDHLTTVRNAERVYSAIGGVPVERWIAEGTHAFDEPNCLPPMRHDPALAREAIARFTGFLGAAFE
jgi:dienelactone hydrolase